MLVCGRAILGVNVCANLLTFTPRGKKESNPPMITQGELAQPVSPLCEKPDENLTGPLQLWGSNAITTAPQFHPWAKQLHKIQHCSGSRSGTWHGRFQISNYNLKSSTKHHHQLIICKQNNFPADYPYAAWLCRCFQVINVILGFLLGVYGNYKVCFFFNVV